MRRARTWNTDTTRPCSRTRILALSTALFTGAALVAPAAADAWTQNHADGQNTARASTDGPHDPGLAWFTELKELTSDTAPEGYDVRALMTRFSDHNEPLVSADGNLIQRAQAQGGEEEPNSLIALDPDDGSLAWEEGDVAAQCGQALDSQDRLWFARDDEDVLEALDPETGEPIAGTSVDLDIGCQRTTLVVGGDTETVVIPDGLGDGIEAFDVSGNEPEVLWTLDTSDDDADAELFRLSLDDGSVLERTHLSDPIGGDTTDIQYATYLVDDGTLVVGLRRESVGDGDGYLAGYDLDTLEEQWFEATDDARGPSRLNLGADGNVHHNAADIDPDDIGTEAQLAAIDDGTLYAVLRDQIVAIDNSGGPPAVPLLARCSPRRCSPPRPQPTFAAM